MSRGADLPVDHVTTRHSSAGSRNRNGSNGVLGLPSTIDPSLYDQFFDLDQLGANYGLTNDGNDFQALDNWIEENSTSLATDGFDANHLQYTELFQADQSGQGLGISFTQPEEYSNPQPSVEPTYNFQVGLDPPVEPPVEPVLHNLNVETLQATSQIDDTTFGLSAIPGSSSFIPDMSQYLDFGQPQSMYPDPSGSVYTNNPYYPATQQQYTGDYIETSVMPAEYYNIPQQNAVQSLRKRKRSQFDSLSSEANMPINKRERRGSNVRPIKSPFTTRSHSSVSEDNSLSKPVKLGVLKAGEKPKKCEDKPWVRINNTTKGETTRTARINQHAEEGRKYKSRDIPHGNWTSTRYTFEYSQNNGMHEFKKRTMSARQIFEYITQYPGNNLRIWIQPVASDSARRYASASHSHCRFEKCPMRVYTGKGTAEVGGYRVAFDEKHKTYGAGVTDPYDCVGYAHLYCMERFLDFAYICQVADVRVDQRVSMEKEPKGHFASAFGPKHYQEAQLANKFVDAASRGRLAETPEFSDYPVHEEYPRGAPKPHERTLVYQLYQTNIKFRANSQMKQFIVDRKIRPGSFPVHCGDLEVRLVDKKIEMLPEVKELLKKVPKKDFNYSAYYNQFHPEIKQRIAKCIAMREKLIAGEERKKDKRSQSRKCSPGSDVEDAIVVTSRRSNKRRAVYSDSEDEDITPRYAPKKRKTTRGVFEDDEDSDIEEMPPPRLESRSSREGLRQRERVNYAEPKDTPPLADVPTLSVTGPTETGLPSNQTFDARKESCSNMFPTNDDEWQNFELPPGGSNSPVITQEQIDALVNAVFRRKSSTLGNGPCLSAVRSSHRVRSAVPRKASFNPQPVTQSKEFRLDDPPARVASGQDGVERQTRRKSFFIVYIKRLRPRSETGFGKPPGTTGSLGAGKSGVVYGLDSKRVLKEFHECEADKKELRVYERLGRHPHITKLLEVRNDGSLILERGTSLRTILQDPAAHKIPTRTKLKWLKDAAKGLEYLHSLNIIHADVGCHNWILTGDQNVKLIDFEGCGIDGEPADSCYEWFSYRPSTPQVSELTDIFAFGCAIYEVLTGRPPYYEYLTGNEPSPRVKELYTNGQFPDVTHLPLCRLIQRCWNGSIGSMGEIVRELKAFHVKYSIWRVLP
ncbi:hypothetical protein yc1106_02047 [Curvularia clavata]|uniref:Protein kinase domain-containing protein n=1 Tax=Curvularia clavata TaxID=95742 RepID=A0A9Q8Z5N3_CURCL|nr:hypothetical protein yc1106_02047 [Curvularia clavata]